MKQIMKFWILALSLMVFGLQAAEAKRFGGGKSFGYSKQIAPKQYKNTPPAANSTPAAGAAAAKSGAQASGASRFLGPLAGLAAGGLLAAMLFGDGFEGLQIMDLLLFVLIGVGIWMFLGRRRAASASAYAGSAYQTPPAQDNVQQRQTVAPSSSDDAQAGGSLIGSAVSEGADHLLVAPAWFDEAAFIEGAKGHFVAVQKAWDALDASELASYCTPELYAALQSEMADLTPGTNHTEVADLNAETVSMSIDGDYFVVSVRFSGFIKENAGADAHAFSEIWHIQRLAEGTGNWQIAGIQQ